MSLCGQIGRYGPVWSQLLLVTTVDNREEILDGCEKDLCLQLYNHYNHYNH
jgi:hypothetical protein